MGAVKDWFEDRAEDVADFFEDAAGKVGDFFEDVGDALEDQFNLLVRGHTELTEGSDTFFVTQATLPGLVSVAAHGSWSVHALGGNDTITILGAFRVNVFTGAGDDTVLGTSAILNVFDTTGDLKVGKLSLKSLVFKTGDGDIELAGADLGLDVVHLGDDGDVRILGAAGALNVLRTFDHTALAEQQLEEHGTGRSTESAAKGTPGGNVAMGSAMGSANIDFVGVSGSNRLTIDHVRGSISFKGAGASNELTVMSTTHWGNSKGSITFHGAGWYNRLHNFMRIGDIEVVGAVAYAEIVNEGFEGNVTLAGIAGYNKILHRTQFGDTIIASLGLNTEVERSAYWADQPSRGNVIIAGASARYKVRHTLQSGNLEAYAAGFVADLTREGWSGDVTVLGAMGGLTLLHKTTHGNTVVGSIGLATDIKRIGLHGNVTVASVSVATSIRRLRADNTLGSSGDVRVLGAAVSLTVESDVWQGAIDVKGLATALRIDRRNGQADALGDITFHGGAVDTRIVQDLRKGHGAIQVYGAALNLEIESTRRSGDITFFGMAGRTSIRSRAYETGNVTVAGLNGWLDVKHTGGRGDMTVVSAGYKVSLVHGVDAGNLTVGAVAAHSVVRRVYRAMAENGGRPMTQGEFRAHFLGAYGGNEGATYDAGAQVWDSFRTSYMASRGNLTIGALAVVADIKHIVCEGDLTVGALSFAMAVERLGWGGDIHVASVSVAATIRRAEYVFDERDYRGAALGPSGSWGDVIVAGTATLARIENLVERGDIVVHGLAGDLEVVRHGVSGGVVFRGAAGNTSIDHHVTGEGDVRVHGVSGHLTIDSTRGSGDIELIGATGATTIRSQVTGAGGNVSVAGVNGWLDLRHTGSAGDVIVAGGNYVLTIEHGTNVGNLTVGSFGFGSFIRRVYQELLTSSLRADGSNFAAHRASYMASKGNVSIDTLSVVADIKHFVRVGHLRVNALSVGLDVERLGWGGDIEIKALSAGITIRRAESVFEQRDANGLTGSWGSVRVEGAAFGVKVENLVEHGDAVFKGAGGGLSVVRRGITGNVDVTSVAGSNTVEQLVQSGDLRAVLVGGGNKVTKTGSGNVHLDMYGGGNVADLRGVTSGHIEASLGGVSNVITLGHGTTADSTINLYGLHNEVTVGEGEDHVRIYGAYAKVRNNGGDATQDDIKVYGAFADVDLTPRTLPPGGSQGAGAATDPLALLNDLTRADGGSHYGDAEVSGGAFATPEESAAMARYGFSDGREQLPGDVGQLGIEESGTPRDGLTPEERQQLLDAGMTPEEIDRRFTRETSTDPAALSDPEAYKGYQGYGASTDFDAAGTQARRDQLLAEHEAGRSANYDPDQHDAVQQVGPVVLDLDGDGVNMSDISLDVDLTGDGKTEKASWLTGGDAFLACDVNSDGRIGREEYIFAAGSGKSDMEVLRDKYDSNHDGKLTRADTTWQRLGLWRDQNRNGVFDAGEFVTLEAAGITSIGINPEADSGRESGGSTLLGTTKFTRADGSTGEAADVSLGVLRESESGSLWNWSSKNYENGKDNTIHAFGFGGTITAGDGDDYVGAWTLGYNGIWSGGGDDMVVAASLINNISTGDGNDTVVALGAMNVIGTGKGDDRVYAFALGNVITLGEGNDFVLAASLGNLIFKEGDGKLTAWLLSLANIVYVNGSGDMEIYALGLANVVHKEGDGNARAVLLGVANSISQVGDSRDGTGINDGFVVFAAGRVNVVTQKGKGTFQAYLLGDLNVTTKVGDGFNRVVALGAANIHTQTGDGELQAFMGGLANVVTKVGDGEVLVVLLGGANLLTHVGKGDMAGIFLGGGNVVTKVGDGDAAILMGGAGNIFSQVGDGHLVALMVGQGNLLTKVGDGDHYLLMGGLYANVVTQVGDGNMIGVILAGSGGNIVTRVGDGDNLLLMAGSIGNVYTQVGDGRLYGILVGRLNLLIKIGSHNYEGGWDKFDGQDYGKRVDGANDGSLAESAIGLAQKGVTAMSGFLANKYIGSVQGAFGYFNILAEVNPHIAADALFDGWDPAWGEKPKAFPDFVGSDTVTNTIQAAIGKYGNVLLKVGDGFYIGAALSRMEVPNLLMGSSSDNAYQPPADDAPGWQDNPLYDPDAEDSEPKDHPGKDTNDSGDSNSSKKRKMSGNLVLNIGRGDAYMAATGTANALIKVGDGGAKMFAVGTGNIMVRVGDAAGTAHAVNIAGYRFAEGVQIAVGRGNVIFNHGVSNDIILAIASVGDIQITSPFGEDGFSLKTELGSYKSTYAPITNTRSEYRLWRANKDPAKIEQLKKEGKLSKATVDRLDKEEKAKREKELKNLESTRQDTMDELKEKIKNLSGNVIVGGLGSDIILAVGQQNLVFGDTVDSFLNLPVNAVLPGDERAQEFLKKIPGVKPIAEILGAAGLKIEFWLSDQDIGGILDQKTDGEGNVSDAREEGDPSWLQTMASPLLDSFYATFKLPGIVEVFGSFYNVITQVSALFKDDEDDKDDNDDASGKPFGWNPEYDKSMRDTSGYAGAGQASGATATYMETAWTNQAGRNNLPAISAFPDVNFFKAIKDWMPKIWDFVVGNSEGDGDGSQQSTTLLDQMKAQFDKMGLLKDNGDIILTGGANNLAFGGAGGDIMALLGELNIGIGGAGNDIFLGVGNDNRLYTDEGNDIAVAIGANNATHVNDGDDFIVSVGSMNRLFGGAGNDFQFALGDSNLVFAGTGNDGIFVAGNQNTIKVDGGSNFVVAFGFQNNYYLGGSKDDEHTSDVNFIVNFGHASVTYVGYGDDIAAAFGQEETLFGDDGNDLLIGTATTKGSVMSGGKGKDTFYVGGSETDYWGDEDADTFVVSSAARDGANIMDLSRSDGDKLALDVDVGVNWVNGATQLDTPQLWFARDADNNLVISVDLLKYPGSGSSDTAVVGTVVLNGWFDHGDNNSYDNQTDLYFNYHHDLKKADILTAESINSMVELMSQSSRSASGGFYANLGGSAKEKINELWTSSYHGATPTNDLSLDRRHMAA